MANAQIVLLANAYILWTKDKLISVVVVNEHMNEKASFYLSLCGLKKDLVTKLSSRAGEKSNLGQNVENLNKKS